METEQEEADMGPEREVTAKEDGIGWAPEVQDMGGRLVPEEVIT
jgi:hypothetical protein